MNEKTWNDVDDFITSLLVPADPVLDWALAASSAAGLPEIAVSPVQGMLLMILAKAVGARRILEIGTLGGYSTIWLARGLPPDGLLISLEFNPTHAAVARDNIDRAGFGEQVEVRVGRAQDTLPELVDEEQGPFDLIFIDADKPGYSDYLEWSLRLARPGTLIIADNVVRQGKVLDADSDDPNARAVRVFSEKMAADRRLASTILQTVGSKGYDGLAFALVTSPQTESHG